MPEPASWQHERRTGGDGPGAPPAGEADPPCPAQTGAGA